MKEKPIVYQMFPRIMTNMESECVADGSYEQNGSGKFNELTEKTLKSIRSLGVTHVPLFPAYRPTTPMW